MFHIHATSVRSLWYKVFMNIDTHGGKLSGIKEIPNTVIELTNNFDVHKDFDSKFRQVFGDERIDYASSVTFVEPEYKNGSWHYRQNADHNKWNATYWGRLIAFNDSVNQIESALKKLSSGKNTKMISMSIYDPSSDHKKVMGGTPCMTSIDIKPRNGKLDISVMFRSMRFSKSGYGDIHALCELSKYIAKRSNMEVNSITLFVTSCHIFYSGIEYKNCKELCSLLKSGNRNEK